MSNPTVPILPILQEIEPAIANKRPKTPSGNPEALPFEKFMQKEGIPSSDYPMKTPEVDAERLRIGSMSYSEFSKMLPGFLDTRTRKNALSEAMNEIPVTSRSEIKDLLNKLEIEWFRLEDSMIVNKDPSFKDLIGLQAQLYKVSEHIGVITKVVDEISGGVKTVLNTNV